jgi:hypothetical protein
MPLFGAPAVMIERQMTKRAPRHSLNERLAALVSYLPLFTAPDFEFGHWVIPQTGDPKIIGFPYYSFSDSAGAFIDSAYQFEWIVERFDWEDWKDTNEATSLLENCDALAEASIEQLERLLTLCVRQDRFCEGAMNSAFQSGLIIGILRRASDILSELQSPVR